MYVAAHVSLVWLTWNAPEMGINRDFYERGVGWEIADMNRPGYKATIVQLQAQVRGQSSV